MDGPILSRLRRDSRAPLGLVFAVWTILAVFIQTSWALIYRVIISKITGASCFQSATKLNTSVPGLATMKGDIIGYANYLKGWTQFLLKSQEKHNETVFAENIGCPVLMALDVKSATKLILEGTNVEDHAHGFNLRTMNELFGGQSPNFERKGKQAKAAREFMLKMMPKFDAHTENKNPRLEAAVKALGTELRRWTRMAASDLQDVEAVEAMGGAIVIFASHLFFGMALEPELVSYIFPVPGFFPTHPHFLPASLGFRDFIPSFLMPSWWKAKYIRDALFKQMKASPNWSAYTVNKPTKVYVSFHCRDDDQLIISRDRNEFDKSQDTEKVVLSKDDRLIWADIVGENGKSASKSNKAFALRFEEGWIGTNADGTKSERKKVPQKEGWVKLEDLDPPLIVDVLENLNTKADGTKKDESDGSYMSDDAACGNMLVALSFNAAGLSNSLLMPFFVLPELLKSNPNLGEDDDFLESFAWEMLRHNGPPIKRAIVTTQAICCCSRDP